MVFESPSNVSYCISGFFIKPYSCLDQILTICRILYQYIIFIILINIRKYKYKKFMKLTPRTLMPHLIKGVQCFASHFCPSKYRVRVYYMKRPYDCKLVRAYKGYCIINLLEIRLYNCRHAASSSRIMFFHPLNRSCLNKTCGSIPNVSTSIQRKVGLWVSYAGPFKITFQHTILYLKPAIILLGDLTRLIIIILNVKRFKVKRLAIILLG